MANPTPPNVATRHDSTWWDTPIGVGVVSTSPVYMGDLPTADPHVVGQLWCDTANSNVIKESQG